MYQILCDGFVLYDPRDEDLSVKNKKCKIGSNICGEASFSIYENHPHYGKLKKLRSVFEIKQDNDTIFRGRMTDDTRDFDNMKVVDLEGAMAYLNDSVIRPFAFPDDFPSAKSADNIVEYFFRWIVEQHNSQVQPFQQFKVGRVTVKDPNNYITRSSTDYSKSWATIKEKLFESSLGGYLCIRYEADGNYLDYLADYVDDAGNKIVNTQKIGYGENLLNFTCESDGKETYSAVIPLGSKVDGDSPLTIKTIADGHVTDDIVKKGEALYSERAVEEYGWICAPTDESTFGDITTAQNLLNRGISFLGSKSAGFKETTTLTAMDLHLTDDEIEAFRPYKYVSSSSNPHDHSGVYVLSVLDIDMDNLQNTKVTVGETKRTLTDKTTETANKVTEIKKNQDKELTKIQTSIKKTETDIMLEVNAKYGELKEETAKIELAVGSINLKVDSVEDDTDKIKQSVSEINLSLDSIGLNVEAIESENQKIKQSVSEISIDVDGIGLKVESIESENQKIEQSVSEMSVTVTGFAWRVQAVEEGLSGISGGLDLALRVDESGVVQSVFGAYVNTIEFKSNTLIVNSDNFSLAANGTVVCDGITARNGDFSGTFTNSNELGTLEISGAMVSATQSDTTNSSFTLWSGHLNLTNGSWDITYGPNGFSVGSFECNAVYTDGSVAFVGTDNYIRFAPEQANLAGTWTSDAAVAVTSDADKKHEIRDITEAYGVIFDNLKPRLYKYNDGTSNRIHVGFVAQEVEAAILAAGLTTQDFAAFVRAEVPNVETGETETVCLLRYEEFIALNTLEIQKLKAKEN